MEKKFLLLSRPATLCIYPKRWTIEWYQYNPNKKCVVRVQRTYRLICIKSISERRKKANAIIQHLNDDLIPYGYPFVEVKQETSKISKVKNVDLKTALERSYQRKIRGKSEASLRSYRSQYRVFMDWIDIIGFNKSINQFTNKHAKQFEEHLKFEKKYGPWAYNNHLGFIKGRFKDLLETDELIEKNPFKFIKSEETGESRFEIFSEHERKVAANRIFDEDIWLFRFILLVYQCHMRKSEIRRLKFSMFDLKRGLIRLGSNVVKKNKNKHVRNIPKSMLTFFKMPDFLQNPQDHYVFGKNMKPHPNKRCGLNTPTHRHRKIINQLEKEGKIEDGKNLHLYGWKFTGITENLKTMKLNTVRKQAGHTDPAITLRYERPEDISPEIQNLDVDIF